MLRHVTSVNNKWTVDTETRSTDTEPQSGSGPGWFLNRSLTLCDHRSEQHVHTENDSQTSADVQTVVSWSKSNRRHTTQNRNTQVKNKNWSKCARSRQWDIQFKCYLLSAAQVTHLSTCLPRHAGTSACVCVCVCVCVLCKHIWRVRSSFVKLSGNLSSFCFTWEAAVYTHTHTHTHTQILLWDGRQMRSAAAGCRCVWSFINPLLSMRTWWCHWSEEDFTSFSQNLIQIYLKLYLKLL